MPTMPTPRSRPILGYALSSEERRPLDLVQNARPPRRRVQLRADLGPLSPVDRPAGPQPLRVVGAWRDRPGHGAAPDRHRRHLSDPRIHPAIIAQAAATTAALMPGRFFLGVGTGENLNEHILGQRWPDWEVRARDARGGRRRDPRLWTGEQTSHRGQHYTVENARIYTLPANRHPSTSPPAVPKDG